MTQMVAAYQENDIEAFEDIIQKHHDAIMGDHFIRERIEELMNNIRTQVCSENSYGFFARNLTIFIVFCLLTANVVASPLISCFFPFYLCVIGMKIMKRIIFFGR